MQILFVPVMIERQCDTEGNKVVSLGQGKCIVLLLSNISCTSLIYQAMAACALWRFLFHLSF